MNKSWIWGIAAAVAASIVTLLITNWLTTHEEGSEALNREMMRKIALEVVKDELETDNGQTVGELLVEMNGTLIEVKTEVRLQGEALRALTE